jgi:hypothetical protein
VSAVSVPTVGSTHRNEGGSRASGESTGTLRSNARGLKTAGWTPESELDEHEWAAAGRRMGAIDRASQWWIGDWLRYGMRRWGEKYAQAARITGYDIPSLRNMAWIAGEFKVSRRRDTLTWSHHAAIAGLEPEQRDMWLDRAESLRLSVSDLRIEVRAAQRDPTVEPGTASRAGIVPEPAHCPMCGQKLPVSHS